MDLHLDPVGYHAPFAMILTGNALAPRLKHRDIIAIDPAPVAGVGDAVLVAFDGRQDRRGVMILNGDGDLVDFAGGYVPAGRFAVIGVVVSSRPLDTAGLDIRTGMVRLPVPTRPETPDYLTD